MNICHECLKKINLLPLNVERGRCKMCKKKDVAVADLKNKHLKKLIGSSPITKVSSGKGKGRRLQQWVEKKVGILTGFEYGKDKPVRSREMGQSGVDVFLDDRVLKVFPYSIECKNSEKWSIAKFIIQTKENQAEGTDWLLFVRKNNHETITIIDAEHFFQLAGWRIKYNSLKVKYKLLTRKIRNAKR